MATELLFLRDSYLKTFEATVTALEGSNKVILDKTAFYYLSGGQPPDKGTLTNLESGNTVPVSDVKRKGGEILHKIGSNHDLEVGTKVQGEIDWDFRYSCMKYHTTLHVLSRVIFDLYKDDEDSGDITGNQIYQDRARMDFTLSGVEFSLENVQKLVDKANDIMSQSLPVSISILSRVDAGKIIDPRRTRLDMIPAAIKEIRVVTLGEDIDNAYDHEACGGTHLKNTGEAGQVELTKRINKGKNNKRIEFILV